MIDSGHDVRVIGPFIDEPYLIERAIRRFYRKQKYYKYIKYNWTSTIRSSNALNKVEIDWKPDIIFSMTPSPFFFYAGSTPCVFRTDTTFLGMNNQGANFLRHGAFMLSMMVWQERIAFSKCEKIITHSDWSEEIIKKKYNIPENKISVFPNPTAISLEDTKKITSNYNKKEFKPLRLLLVGREYERKGVDIAIDIVRVINNNGIKAILDIVGINGDNKKYYKFHGHFQKDDKNQLNKYLNFFHRAHLLIHPARFDASPIVTSEAAAFSTPTITNNSGGIATSVKHGVSGIVLARESKPISYAESITSLIKNSKKYKKLCESTLNRYKKELNWNIADKSLNNILNDAMNGK